MLKRPGKKPVGAPSQRRVVDEESRRSAFERLWFSAEQAALRKRFPVTDKATVKALRRCERVSMRGWSDSLADMKSGSEANARVYALRRIIPAAPEPSAWLGLGFILRMRIHPSWATITQASDLRTAVRVLWGDAGSRRHLDSKHWKAWLEFVDEGHHDQPGFLLWPDGTRWLLPGIEVYGDPLARREPPFGFDGKLRPS